MDKEEFKKEFEKELQFFSAKAKEALDKKYNEKVIVDTFKMTIPFYYKMKVEKKKDKYIFQKIFFIGYYVKKIIYNEDLTSEIDELCNHLFQYKKNKI